MKIFRHRSEPSRALCAAERLFPSHPARTGRAVPLLILSLLLAAIFLFPGTSPALAQETQGTCGDGVTWTLDDEGTLTISGTGEMYDYAQTDAPWENYRSDITHIFISGGVTSIGDYAFAECTRLTSVTFGDGSQLTSIGNGAFAYCKKLTSVTIPGTVKSIGTDAFHGCTDLTSVTIPDNSQLTSIGEDAFHSCMNLTSVTIPEKVTSIGAAAFAFSGLESVTIPEKVTSIGQRAFESCSRLTGLVVNENNPNYSSRDGVLFSKDGKTLIQFPGGKSGEDGLYVIPGSVKTIGKNAFHNCDALKTVIIPSGVETILSDAFWACDALETVTIPETVTSIGASAFSYCGSLSSVTINRTTKPLEIGVNAFYRYPGTGDLALNVAIDSSYPTLDFDITEEAGYEKSGSSLLLTDSYKSTAAADLTLYCDISVEVKPEDSGSVTGAGHKAPGETVTLSPSPAEYYVFDKWTEGESVFTANPYTFTAEKNRSLTANFKLDISEVSVTVNPEGSGSVKWGGGTYLVKNDVQVFVEPIGDYVFVNFTENGEVVSSNNPYEFTVTGGRHLTANFADKYNSVTVSADPPEGGTVSGGGNSIPYGESTMVTATPATGYSFVNWTEGEDVVSTDAGYTFTVTGARDLVAHFVKLHQISAEAKPAEGGTVSGGGDIAEGTSDTVTATPAAGYSFVNWTEGGVEVSTDASYTFTVSGARTLTANFAELPPDTYSVTVTTDGNGTASASPASGTKGTEVTLTAEPAEGYQFSEWQVLSGGVSVTDNKFTIGTANVEVKAVFTDYTYTGEGQDHQIGSGEDTVFRITRSVNDEESFDKFEGIRMDGEIVDKKYYDAYKGSVIIHLHADYMDTLKPGKHTLTALFSDGEEKVPFKVTEPEKFEVKVYFVFLRNDSSRGLPFDIKLETLKPVLSIKDGDEVISKSEPVELTLTLEKNEIPKTASFPKEVELSPGKYTVSVSGLPKEIGKEIPDGNAKDAPKYSLTAKAEINTKDGKPVITVYLIFTPPALKVEPPVVYILPEDEIGAYALLKDGTKEYLLFQTYDICMEWLGRDDLCRGYERCFHKDGK